jgi:hypothetical protein
LSCAWVFITLLSGRGGLIENLRIVGRRRRTIDPNAPKNAIE